MTSPGDVHAVGRAMEHITVLPTQLGVLYDGLARPGTGFGQVGYRLPAAWSIEDSISAWHVLSRRHPALRTRVELSPNDDALRASIDDQAVPILVRARSVKVPNRGLLNSALFNVTLHPQRQAGIEMTVDYHQAFMDGWSLNRLLGEFESLMLGFDLEEPGDYLGAVDSVLRCSGEPDTFWADSFQSARTRALRLPTGTSSVSVEHQLSRESVRRIKARASQLRVTPAAVSSAAWARVLADFTDADDVCVGLAVSGRAAAAIPDDVIGGFACALPMLLKGVRSGDWTEISASAMHQILQIQQRDCTSMLDVLKAIGQTTLPFDSLFAFENYPRPAFSSALQRTYVIEETGIGATCQLALVGEEGHIAVITKYQEPYARALVDQFVDELTRDGHTHSAPSSSSHVVGDIRSSYVVETTIVDELRDRLFEDPARSTHVAGEGSCTSADVLGLAVKLTHVLGADRRPVAIMLPRGVFLGQLVLATVSSGRAFVPIDHEAPRSVIDHVLATANPSCLVTDRLREWSFTCRTLRTDEFEYEPASEDGAFLASLGTVVGSGAAYILFTSGSTGRPKGVEVGFQALSNRIRWMRDELGLSSVDVFLLKTPYTFDVSVWEFVLPASVGATTVVLPEGDHRSPEAVRRSIHSHGVTVVHFVPSMLREYCVFPGLDPCPSVQHLVCSGEALTVELVALARQAFPNARIWNYYGPTEAAIDVTRWECVPGPTSMLPIGLPAPNCDIAVSSDCVDPLPRGVPGEILIGGVQLATAYVGDPRRTAETFIPDPTKAGQRRYRTGDEGRVLSDGSIEYLGRLDEQVKIRGMRVEPEGVASIISAEPGVDQCAVVAEDFAGVKRLVAHVVATDTTVDLRQLERDISRSLSRRLLPAAMPSRIVFQESLPLTASGKLDRGSLRNADFEMHEDTSGAGRSRVERQIAAVFRSILGRELGPIDDFFQNGGDSILAMRTVALARKSGLALTTRMLLENPTSAGLERALAARERTHAVERAIPPTAPLLPCQSWFFQQAIEEPSHRAYSLRMELTPARSVREVEGALHRLVDWHPALRMYFTEDAQHGLGRPMQVLEVDMVGAAEPWWQEPLAVLDIYAGPCSAAVMFVAESGLVTHVGLVLHRLITDVVSFNVLLDSLDAALRGESSPVLGPQSPLTWAQVISSSNIIESAIRTLTHWQETVSSPAQRIPLDHEGSNTFDASDREWAVLNGEDTQRLRTACSIAGVTLEDAVLGTFALALSQWSGGDQFRIYVGNHGRSALLDDFDLAGTVGWFTTTYPLNIRAHPSLDPVRTSEGVKEARQLMPDDGLSFAILRYMRNEQSLVDGEASRAINFNFMGVEEATDYQSDAIGEVEEFPLPRRGSRPYELELHAFVVTGELRVGWRYCRALHDQETIRRALSYHMEYLIDFGTNV